MAKFAYDVNKQTKIIDVQKQFPGGLKTVDTDDALGQVYLRQADNVSLSEFSFLEKRHGSYIEHTIEFNSGDEPEDLSKPIQGYFEYSYLDDNNNVAVDKLLFIDGKAYIKQNGESVYFLKDVYYVAPEFQGTLNEADINGLVSNEIYDFEREIFIPLTASVKDVETSFYYKYFAGGISIKANVSFNVSEDIYELVNGPSVDINLTASLSEAQGQTLEKQWVAGGGVPADLTINLGEVATCPIESEALALVEAQYPAINQNVGTTAVVNAFRDVNGSPQICSPQTFVVQIV